MTLTLHLNHLAAKDEIVKIHQTIDWPNTGRRDVLDATPLNIELEVEPITNAILVKGTMESHLTFACARCLERFEEDVLFKVDEGFTRDASLAESDEEDRFQLIEEEVLDLKPHLEEIAIVSLPMAPLCKEDCLGLCPDCGVNHNETSCSCKEEKIDPRLEGLKDFFKNK